MRPQDDIFVHSASYSAGRNKLGAVIRNNNLKITLQLPPEQLKWLFVGLFLCLILCGIKNNAKIAMLFDDVYFGGCFGVISGKFSWLLVPNVSCYRLYFGIAESPSLRSRMVRQCELENAMPLRN